MQSESIANLAGAIIKAQLELKPVKKDCDNPFYKSKYADLASVWEALRPFHDHGIAITQSPAPSPHAGYIAIETQLTHSSGEWIRSILELPMAKVDPQGAGSAITYARRYALGCMTGLVTEEDDDANSVSQPPTRTPYQHKQTAQQKINELRKEAYSKPEAQGAGSQVSQPEGPPPQASDNAPPAITDEIWHEFLEYVGDDPERTKVGKVIKDQLKITTMSAVKAER